MEKKLRNFLSRYLDNPETTNKLKKDIVTQDQIDALIFFAKQDHLEQEIIDYGTAHPEAPFWDLLKIGEELL